MVALATAAGCKSTSEAIESAREPENSEAQPPYLHQLTLLSLTPVIDSVNTDMLPVCVFVCGGKRSCWCFSRGM